MAPKKRKKNLAAQIVASIALLAIFIGIVGTSILFIVSSFTPSAEETTLTQEQIQQLLESMSGSVQVEETQEMRENDIEAQSQTGELDIEDISN